jgi:hypothetical protein
LTKSFSDFPTSFFEPEPSAHFGSCWRTEYHLDRQTVLSLGKIVFVSFDG